MPQNQLQPLLLLPHHERLQLRAGAWMGELLLPVRLPAAVVHGDAVRFALPAQQYVVLRDFNEDKAMHES